MSVDLPAPFSPQIAWISPRRTSRLTFSSALTPGKVLVIERISRMLSAMDYVVLVCSLVPEPVCGRCAPCGAFVRGARVRPGSPVGEVEVASGAAGPGSGIATGPGRSSGEGHLDCPEATSSAVQ